MAEYNLVTPSFGLNSFGQPKYKNPTETIANAFLNLLFGRPGYFPSIPTLGIDIQSYLYSFWSDINPDEIKAKIALQCQAFKEYIDDGTLDVIKSWYKDQPLLLIQVPVQIKMTRQTLQIGVSKDTNGNVLYNYQLVE